MRAPWWGPELEAEKPWQGGERGLKQGRIIVLYPTAPLPPELGASQPFLWTIYCGRPLTAPPQSWAHLGSKSGPPQLHYTGCSPTELGVSWPFLWAVTHRQLCPRAGCTTTPSEPLWVGCSMQLFPLRAGRAPLHLLRSWPQPTPGSVRPSGRRRQAMAPNKARRGQNRMDPEGVFGGN